MMKTTIGRIALILGGIFLLLQVVQPERTNPPSSVDDLRRHLPASPRVAGLLRAACFDCHSNQTRWPWYSYVAPVSWLVSRDVEQGRKHLNFSQWASYERRKQIGRLGAVAEEVGDGEMPLPIYAAMHKEANLSTEDRDSLAAWAEQMRALLIDQDRAEKDSSTATD